MGVSATFSVLSALPPGPARLLFAEAALREPYPELQAAAVEALADPSRLGRPDLVLVHYGDLLPEVRRRIAARPEAFRPAAQEALRAAGEWSRRAALEVLADLDGPSALPVLARALADPSPVVREAAADLLERMAVPYLYALVAWRLHGDGRSGAFVRTHRPAVLAALGEALRLYPLHEKRALIDLAIESDPDSYGLLADLASADPQGALARALRDALAQAVTPTAVEVLLKLWLDPRPGLGDLARDVFRRRTEPAFPSLLAEALARRPPDRFEALASRVSEIPWWPAVEAHPNLDPLASARLMEFVAASGLDPLAKVKLLGTFRRARHAPTRVRLLEVFEERGLPGLLELALEFVKDPAAEVRRAAAHVLVRLSPPRKERLWVPLLESSDPEVRRLAGREIAAAGFEKYLRSFDRLDGRTRELAARALAKIDARLLERLIEQLTSLDSDRRLKALRIIDYVEAEQELRELLVELLGDPDRRVRATVVKIVELSDHPEGRRLLAGALKDPDSRVRANAVESLEEAGDVRLAPLLEPCLRDPDNRVRANAAKALARLGRPEEGRRALEAMLEDAAEEMRLSAAWALGELGDPFAEGILAAREAREPSPLVRARIAEARRKLGGAP